MSRRLTVFFGWLGGMFCAFTIHAALTHEWIHVWFGALLTLALLGHALQGDPP